MGQGVVISSLNHSNGISRATIRIPEWVYKKLKQEADDRVLPVNSVIRRVLENYVIFFMKKDILPTILMSQTLSTKIIETVSQKELTKLALQGPKTIKNLFALLDIDYTLQNIINSYFNIVEKYCGWYTFKYSNKSDHLHLIFKTLSSQKWNKFILMYVREILDSLKLTYKYQKINDSIIVFKIFLK